MFKPTDEWRPNDKKDHSTSKSSKDNAIFSIDPDLSLCRLDDHANSKGDDNLGFIEEKV